MEWEFQKNNLPVLLEFHELVSAAYNAGMSVNEIATAIPTYRTNIRRALGTLRVNDRLYQNGRYVTVPHAQDDIRSFYIDKLIAAHSKLKQMYSSEPVHGSKSTYTNHHCRCDLCKAANAAYTREKIASRKNIACKHDGKWYVHQITAGRVYEMCSLCLGKIRRRIQPEFCIIMCVIL